MIEIIITVDGMMCSMCEAHVNDAVRNVAGVKKVTSSHRSGEVHAVCEESVDRDALISSVEKLGYRVVGSIEKTYEKRGFFASLFGKKG